MTFVDRLLQRWRIAKVKGFVSPGAAVLDIGCSDAALFDVLPEDCYYVGVDPELRTTARSPRMELIHGSFPEALPAGRRYDVVTVLAAFEHVPDDEQPAFIEACHRALVDGGLAILTVPHPRVDDILHVLSALRLIDGIEIHQHHGYDVSQTTALFEGRGFELAQHSRFQLGLNNVFVFRKTTLPVAATAATVASTPASTVQ